MIFQRDKSLMLSALRKKAQIRIRALLEETTPALEHFKSMANNKKINRELKKVLKGQDLTKIVDAIKSGDSKSAVKGIRSLNISLESFEKRMLNKPRRWK